jgi:hypothetical protein
MMKKTYCLFIFLLWTYIQQAHGFAPAVHHTAPVRKVAPLAAARRGPSRDEIKYATERMYEDLEKIDKSLDISIASMNKCIPMVDDMISVSFMAIGFELLFLLIWMFLS